MRVKLSASLAYRMTVGFVFLFLVLGVLLLLIFTGIRLNSVYKEKKEFADGYVKGLEREEENSEELESAGGALTVYSPENREEVYQIGERIISRNAGKWLFVREGQNLLLYAKYRTEINMYGTICEGEFVFECTAAAGQILREVFWFGMWYLVIGTVVTLLFFAMHRTVMQPIKEMSEQVNCLNLHNIHGQRLNAAGTMDELKLLAFGINGMLDRMEQSYESQKQFVSEASHELRTPITVLQGYSAMLRRWGAEDKEVLTESVEAIESEAKSMQELVEKLLFLSRHERKKLPFHKEIFEMGELVGELEKETVYLAKERKIQYPLCEAVKVFGDRQLLKQALRIFLDNAIKYTEEGDEIRISCRNKKGACEITVEDTGIGMRKEDLEGIFGRFFRADTVRGKNIEGHGLGLSIARLIIDGHGGKIGVKTQYTKGSTFIITIPRQRGV